MARAYRFKNALKIIRETKLICKSSNDLIKVLVDVVDELIGFLTGFLV